MNLSEYKQIKCVIISGMAKTGTTLPLTLLDNHPDLLVFPEELRFFHLGCDKRNGKHAVDRFFNNFNIKQLAQKELFYQDEDYLKHGGTGFGKRDYSMFDFNKFEQTVRELFENYSDPSDRFYGIIYAFKNALGEDQINNRTIFVCKAPHNELYIKKWKRILNPNSKYIISTRIPTEHFLSLKNIESLIGRSNTGNAYRYVNSVKSRLRLWNQFPQKDTLILDYDALLNNSKETITSLCSFLGIGYDESLLTPTKMGVPWAGNSSRGIVKEKIFKNEHKASKLLEKREIEIIETGLQDLYEKMNWPKILQVDASKMKRYKFYTLIHKFDLKRRILKWKNKVFQFLFKCQPKTITNRLRH